MKRKRAFVVLSWLAAALVACVLSSGAKAQESAQPAQQQASEQSQKHHGVGAELAQETREAAGEDDHAAFKKSGAVRAVARLMGGDVELAYWVCVALNFAIVFGILFWAGRKYLPGVFRNRTQSIQKAMEEARRASEDANRRLTAVEERLAKLGDEIKEMTATAERAIVEEEARTKVATEEETRRIVEAAEQEIEAAGKAARRDLTQYAADLAVNLAQRQIHVDESTDEALVRQFSKRIAGEGSKN